MDIISVEEWELLSFFEVEPKGRNDELWPYNDNLYEVVQGEIFLSCAIQPAYKDVRIVVNVAGQNVINLQFSGIQDIRYVKEKGKESLRFDITDQEFMTLQVKPQIDLRLDHLNLP